MSEKGRGCRTETKTKREGKESSAKVAGPGHR